MRSTLTRLCARAHNDRGDVPGWVLITLMTAGLVIGPTVIGHSLMNRAMTRLPPQTVSLFNLTQFISAGILGFLVFGELPAPAFAIASVLIVAGVAIPVLSRRRI